MAIGPDLECLTEGQRDCLRLVMLHMSSKEIARTLGISPHTVDQRLRVATRNLGVSTRFEAARLLAMHGEAAASATYQPLIYQVPGLGRGDANQSSDPGVETGSYEPVETGLEMELNAAQVAYPLYTADRQAGLKWPLPPIWGTGANALSLTQRMTIILMIALGSLLAFGTFLSGLDALSRLI